MAKKKREREIVSQKKKSHNPPQKISPQTQSSRGSCSVANPPVSPPVPPPGPPPHPHRRQHSATNRARTRGVWGGGGIVTETCQGKRNTKVGGDVFQSYLLLRLYSIENTLDIFTWYLLLRTYSIDNTSSVNSCVPSVLVHWTHTCIQSRRCIPKLSSIENIFYWEHILNPNPEPWTLNPKVAFCWEHILNPNPKP